MIGLITKHADCRITFRSFFMVDFKKNKNLSSLLADDVFHKRMSIGMTPSAVHINGIETLDKLVLDRMYIKPA